MKTLLKPYWVYIVLSIPQIILFWIFYGNYAIINTLLQPEQLRLWTIFGSILLGLNILYAGYATFLLFIKKSMPPFLGIVILLSYVPFLYFFTLYGEQLISWEVPRWMISSDELLLYAYTFIMPALAYAIFLLVIISTPEEKNHKAWLSFLSALSIPLAWYLFYTVIIPAINNNLYPQMNYHFLVILLLTSTVIFLFFLVRTFFILLSKKSGFLNKYSLIWKIPIVLILPIIGLILNSGKYFPHASNFENMFGDFSHPIFFITTFISGVLLCIPPIKNQIWRMILFVLKSITLSFTFYFFIVFLPFLPLSVLAVIAFGLGFLLLSPIILFIVHIKSVSEDILHFIGKYDKTKIRLIFLSSLLVFPLGITSFFAWDKMNLYQALDYIYEPQYNAKDVNVNAEALEKTLENIQLQKTRRNNNFFEHKTGKMPYISSFYNWLVLDNMTLSDSKIKMLQEVF